MAVKCFVDPQGRPHICVDGATPPAGSIEVATRPAPDREQLWDFQSGTWKDAAPLVPQSITPLQARKALRAAGLYQHVQTYISGQPEEVQDEWEYATAIERDNALIAAAAAVLGLTSQEVDGLFILGAGL